MDVFRSTRSRTVPPLDRLCTFAAVAAITLVISTCSDLTGPLPREGAPDELKFSLVAFEGAGGSTWELQGETVVHRSITGFSTPVVTDVRTIPSAEAWRAFWLATERVGLRRWRRDYTAEGIVDGVGWSTRIRAGNVLIESGGSNAYPDEFGREHELESTEAFEAYVAALRRLVGQS